MCDYGEHKDSFICDKIINACGDTRLIERLLDLTDAELKNLSVVTDTCRKHELSRAHLRALEDKDGAKNATVHKTDAHRGHGIVSLSAL